MTSEFITDEGQWRKASLSLANGECVEVSVLADGGIGVRDSKDPDGGILTFTRREFAAWVHGVKAGEFDDLV